MPGMLHRVDTKAQASKRLPRYSSLSRVLWMLRALVACQGLVCDASTLWQAQSLGKTPSRATIKFSSI